MADQVFNHIAAAVQGACCAPIALGNAIQVLEDGEPTFAVLLRSIAAAEHSINVEHFKIHSDATGWEFASVLAERALAGVPVNLLYDALGSLSASADFWAFLSGAGVSVHPFHPLTDGTRAIVRTHRKLIIIDGRIAYIGGHCIGDEWSGRKPDEPAWRDTLCRVEGPAVADLQAAFYDLWEQVASCTRPQADPRYFPPLKPEGSSAVMTLTCGSERGIKHAYREMIASARERVMITNAYFHPDGDIVEALKDAARRGISVRIIVPGKSDIDIMITAARSIYSELLEVGVEIYEYQPTVLHAKTAVADGCWAMVGSCNLDARSLDVNYEANIAIIDAQIASLLEAQFEADLQQSRRIDLEEWRQRPLTQKVGELIIGMLGPQL